MVVLAGAFVVEQEGSGRGDQLCFLMQFPGGGGYSVLALLHPTAGQAPVLGAALRTSSNFPSMSTRAVARLRFFLACFSTIFQFKH